MSIEIRHVVTGDCDCRIPKFSWERTNGHGHHWECDYGRIPSFDINSPAPLMIDDSQWVRDVYVAGGRLLSNERLHTITIVPVDDGVQITADTKLRMFHRIDYRGQSWTWELEPAHFADPPTKRNNAHRPIYLGRWPD